MSQKKSDDMGTNEFSFKITVAAAQGGRRYMEDRVHVEAVRDLYGNLSHLFAAVYDGHGGPQASEYVKQHLHNNIQSIKSFYSDDDNEVLSAIRQGFIKTHYNMQKMLEEWPLTTSGFPCTAGTTASVSILRNGKIYTGHVGDSIIAVAEWPELTDNVNCMPLALKLTEDHKPENEVERTRIENIGGAVAMKAGVHRVIWKRPVRGHLGPIRRSTSTENIPFLAVARAIGDFWSLNPENNEYIVSPDPDVSVRKFSANGGFIVLASDGLTNVMRLTQMVDNLNYLLKMNLSAFDCEFLTKDKNREMNFAQYMLKHALENWRYVRADNISVICIQLVKDQSDSLLLTTENNFNCKQQNGLQNDYNLSCVAENVYMNIDKELTEFPSAMIYVTSKTTRRYLTNPIKIVYPLAFNKKEKIECYKGPGFLIPQLPYEDNLSDDEINDSYLTPIVPQRMQYSNTFTSLESKKLSSNLLNTTIKLNENNNKLFNESMIVSFEIPTKKDLNSEIEPENNSTNFSNQNSILNETVYENETEEEVNVLSLVTDNEDLELSEDDASCSFSPLVQNEKKKCNTINQDVKSKTFNQKKNVFTSKKFPFTKKISTPVQQTRKTIPLKLSSPIKNTSSTKKTGKVAIKKKKAFNEKFLSKCQSFGGVNFNELLMNAKSSPINSKTSNLEKNCDFAEELEKNLNNVAENKKESKNTGMFFSSKPTTSRFSSFNFLRSGKLFHNGSAPAFGRSQTGSIKSTDLECCNLKSSSQLLQNNSLNVSNNSASTSSSTLLSPFTVLASIRSSAAASTSNLDLMYAQRLSSSFITNKDRLENSSLAQSNLHDYKKDSNVQEKSHFLESKTSINNDLMMQKTPKSTHNLSANQALKPVNKQNVQKRQPVYMNLLTKKLNTSSQENVDKFLPESPVKSTKLVSTLSSASSSRKRPNHGTETFSDQFVGLAPVDALPQMFATTPNDAVSKRMRLNHQNNVILKAKNSLDLTTEHLMDINSSSTKRKHSSNEETKRSHTRSGIWNFVSSVFSKYMS